MGLSDFLIRSSMSPSNLARVMLMKMFLGPELVTVIYGRLMLVWVVLDNSTLAFSHASLMRCRAVASLLRSSFSLVSNSFITYWMSFWSTSSPPSIVSPLVALTSKTFSFTSRMEMSKVPPPRS